MLDQRTMIGVIVIVLLAVIAALLFRANRAGQWRVTMPQAPKRHPTQSIQVLERFPSDGLVWSKTAYRGQYGPENLKTASFEGIDDFENERFLDIAGRAYSRKFLEHFSYTNPSAERPQVTVEYLARGEAFAGRVIGTGLKPNFAYQLKLRGRWEDRAAFENIGRTGRWRLPGRGTNYTDKDYEAYEDKYLVEAYILFDFMVTDPFGNVDKEFYLDSSLHVLWNYNTQRSPSSLDSRPTIHTRAGTHRELYANPRVELSPHRIYAESEQKNRSSGNNRKPVGQAFLPPGHYTAELVLTEESFHGYGDCGFWATVMYAPVAFEVVDQPTPPFPSRARSAQVGEFFALDKADHIDIETTAVTPTAIEGSTESKKSAVILAEELQLPAGKRYLLIAEVLSEGNHMWQVFVRDSAEEFFFEKPDYRLASRGRKVWQRFEVEITSAVAGKRVRLKLAPSMAPGPVGIRNVAIHEIVEDAPTF